MCYLNNICFVCLSNKDNLIAVYHKESDNEIFMQVKYALPELIVNTEIPVLYICSSCNTTLRSFFLLKKKCLENYSRLSDYLNILQKNNDTPGQSFSGVQIRVNNCVPLVNHENDINLNIEENEVKLQDDQKPEASDNVEVKEESLASEDDSTDRAFYQHFVKCEYVSDDEQDGGTSVTSEDNNALDKDETNSHADSQNFQCSICNELCTDRVTLDSHLRNHINTITNLECLICNKKCSSKYDLTRHMKFHLGMRDFKCTICRKTFIEKCNLNKHMKMHEGIKNNGCPICEKKFSRSSDLNKHMKIHSGIRDYECSICKKKFSRSNDLNKHMKIHAGIKDNECSICKKKFSQSGYLKIHMKIHAGIKDYECSVCNKKFVRKDKLKRHADTHQND